MYANTKLQEEQQVKALFFCNAQPQVLLGLYRFLLPVQLREANCSSLAALRALSLEDAQNILVGP